MVTTHPDFQPSDDSPSPAAIPLPQDHSRLWEEMSEALSRHGREDLAALRQELQRDGVKETGWGRAVHQQLERLGEDAALASAAKLGREWLAGG